MNFAFLYIAALYGAFVVLFRRFDDGLGFRTAILFYGLVLGFLFAPLTMNVVDLPANFLNRLPPWSAVLPPSAVPNEVLNDLTLQIVPWAHQVREAWKSFEIPLWNAASGGGYPLLANAQSGAFSPLRLVALPFELGVSLAVEAALELLLALTFAYLWAIRREFSEIASIVIAIAFSFSTGITTWLHFPLAGVAALIPLIFYAIDRLVERGEPRDVALAAVAFGAALLMGHPESAAHSLSAGGAWFAFTVWVERRGHWRRSLAGLAIASGIALLLAAPLLLPFLEALPESLRIDALRNGFESSPVNRSPELFVVLLHPGFFGYMGGVPWGAWHPEFVGGSAGMLAATGWFVVLFEVIATRRWRSQLSFFAFAILIALGAIFAIPPVSTIFDVLPPFSFAANGRLRILICWFAAVCAGAAIDLIRQGKVRVAAAATSIVLVALLASFVYWEVFAWNYRLRAVANAVPGLLSIASAFLLSFPGRWRKAAGPLIVVSVIAELWPFGLAWNRDVPARELYPSTPLTETLVEMAAADPIGPSRFAGLGPSLFPNSAAMYGLEDIRAHDAMACAKTLGMLRVFTGYTTDQYFATIERFDHPFLDFMNVRYVVSAESVELDERGFEEVYHGVDGRIWRNHEAMRRFMIAREVVVEPDRRARVRRIVDLEDWSRTAIVESPPGLVGTSFDPRDTIDIIEAKGDRYRLRVNASDGRLIVSSLPWYDGWKVSANGTAVKPLRVNGGFVGFVVPGGPSDVRVAYRPRSFAVGVALFFAGLACLLAQVAGRPRRASASRGSAGIAMLLAVGLLIPVAAGCSDHQEADRGVAAYSYPGARQLHQQEVILHRAHALLNPGADAREIVILETADSVESVALFYAARYGIRQVVEDTVNDFSATLPPAYYREGDIGEDVRQYAHIVAALGLPFDPESISGSYRGAQINGTSTQPTITIQRPYIELPNGTIVDRTVILISKE